MEIRVENLWKRFGRQEVLKGVSLDIRPGRITFLIGGSGTGKSVFLKHLIGLLQPDSGSIVVDGQEITELSEGAMMDVRRRFGMIFQNGALLASMTLCENVSLALVENGLAGRKEARDIACEKLRLVGMDGQADKYPSMLSGGMRKRAAIARALTTQPECILYDEPTAGLDPPRARQIDDLIRDVNQSLNTTSIVVTHDMDSVRKLADKVYMLHEGRIVFAGSPDQMGSSDEQVVRDFIER